MTTKSLLAGLLVAVATGPQGAQAMSLADAPVWKNDIKASDDGIACPPSRKYSEPSSDAKACMAFCERMGDCNAISFAGNTCWFQQCADPLNPPVAAGVKGYEGWVLRSDDPAPLNPFGGLGGFYGGLGGGYGYGGLYGGSGGGLYGGLGSIGVYTRYSVPDNGLSLAQYPAQSAGGGIDRLLKLMLLSGGDLGGTQGSSRTLVKMGAEGSGDDWWAMGNKLTLQECGQQCGDKGYPHFSYYSQQNRASHCTAPDRCACYCYSSLKPTPHPWYNLYTSVDLLVFNKKHQDAIGSGASLALGNSLMIEECASKCFKAAFAVFSYYNQDTTSPAFCNGNGPCECTCYESAAAPSARPGFGLFAVQSMNDLFN